MNNSIQNVHVEPESATSKTMEKFLLTSTIVRQELSGLNTSFAVPLLVDSLPFSSILLDDLGVYLNNGHQNYISRGTRSVVAGCYQNVISTRAERDYVVMENLIYRKNPKIKKITVFLDAYLAVDASEYYLVRVYSNGFNLATQKYFLSEYVLPNQTNKNIIQIPINRNINDDLYFLVGIKKSYTGASSSSTNILQTSFDLEY